MNEYTFRVQVIGGSGYTKTVQAKSFRVALHKTFKGMFTPTQRRDAHIDWLGEPRFTVFAGNKPFATITPA